MSLSYRAFTDKKRGKLCQDQVQDFLYEFMSIKEKFSQVHLVNFDETAWWLTLTPKRTLTQKGAAEVRVNTDEKKQNFTAIASVTLSGKKLPLYFLARAKTNLCHRQFSDEKCHIDETKNPVFHSPSGWTNSEIAGKYLRWLRNELTGEKRNSEIVLIWDSYPCHHSPETLQIAKEEKIRILLVPPNATFLLQALDRGVLGPLKRIGDKLWLDKYMNCPLSAMTTPKSAQLLLEAWEKITKECIVSSWDLPLPDEFEGMASALTTEDNFADPLYEFPDDELGIDS